MPTLLDASDGRRAAAHTVVEHRVALVGVGQNEIAQQVNGLLGGVPTRGRCRSLRLMSDNSPTLGRMIQNDLCR